MKREPKAELHAHIEGTASPALALEMAAKHGVDLAGLVEDGRYRWSGFSQFLAAYDRIAHLFRSEDDYRRLAFDYLSGLGRDATIYSELTVSLDHARAAGLSASAYLDAIASGAAQAQDETGIVCRLIVVGVRHLGPQAVEAVAREAARLRHPLVTGFGLAGDERMYRPADFAPAFDIARDAGLGLTAHAGEFAGADGVRQTLEALKVGRVGHGVRAIEDERVVAQLVEDAVTLEVCPGSNIALGVYPRLADHPLRRLQQAGVRVTLNSDDPPLFATDLSREYALAGDLGLGPSERMACTRNAIQAAFVDEETRRRLDDRLVRDALSLGAREPSV